MNNCWTRRNQPLLLSLISQLFLAVIDVGSNQFSRKEAIDSSGNGQISHYWANRSAQKIFTENVPPSWFIGSEWDLARNLPSDEG